MSIIVADEVHQPSVSSDYTHVEGIPNVLETFKHFTGYLSTRKDGNVAYVLMANELHDAAPNIGDSMSVDHMGVLALLCSAIVEITQTLDGHTKDLAGIHTSLSKVYSYLNLK